MNRKGADILVVEDNMYMNIALQTLVTSFVESCDYATDGEEALQYVKTKYEQDGSTYKLIIMDYEMPICNGLDASRKIRDYLAKRTPQAQKQPCIILTAV